MYYVENGKGSWGGDNAHPDVDIPHELPALNRVIDESKRHWSKYSQLKRLGLLTFSGYRFGVNSPRVSWVNEVNKDERVVGKAIGEVLPVLRSETPPESNEDCEWCRYAKLRVDL